MFLLLYVLPLLLQLSYTIFAIYNKWFDVNVLTWKEYLIMAFFILCPLINQIAVFISIEEIFRYYEDKYHK